MNDSLLTTLCLQYRPFDVAAAVVYLTYLFVGLPRLDTAQLCLRRGENGVLQTDEFVVGGEIRMLCSRSAHVRTRAETGRTDNVCRSSRFCTRNGDVFMLLLPRPVFHSDSCVIDRSGCLLPKTRDTGMTKCSWTCPQSLSSSSFCLFVASRRLPMIYGNTPLSDMPIPSGTGSQRCYFVVRFSRDTCFNKKTPILVFVVAPPALPLSRTRPQQYATPSSHSTTNMVRDTLPFWRAVSARPSKSA